MGTRNASPSAFGWNFQANSAIFLMIENIKGAEKIRVEGVSEDIEIWLNDKTKIYSQVKSVTKPEDYSHVDKKLADALETLDLAAKNGDGSLFTYITNSPNPFHNTKTMSYFHGVTHLHFNELPETAQKKISRIIQNKGYTNLDCSKLDIRVIPFYGDDPKNRFKEIKNAVSDLLGTLNVSFPGIENEILEIWQKFFSHNATQINTAITIDKNEMIWPLIVLVIDKVPSAEYKKDFNDEEIEEVERKYKQIINQYSMLYGFTTKVIADFIKSKSEKKTFIESYWKNYVNIVSALNADEQTKETLIKIIINRILTQRNCINDIKKGVNL